MHLIVPCLIASLAQLPVPRGLFPDHAVIAIAGGEDMVVMQELGHFEAARLAEVPDAGWTFRGFAREGDTVFEQPREPGFPAWEEILERERVSVVIAQFGQTEALSGADLSAFGTAYETLVSRWQAGGAQVWLIAPFTPGNHARLDEVRERVRDVALRAGAAFVDTRPWTPEDLRADGIHLNERGHRVFATAAFRSFPLARAVAPTPHLVGLVREKNRLWSRHRFPVDSAWLGPEEAAGYAARLEAAETRLRRHFHPADLDPE